MPPDAVCDRCQQPASRTLAAEWLCGPCHDTTMDPIRERVAQRSGFVGWGVATGPPDHGWSHLTCHTCGATWIGKPYDPCWWCDNARQRIADHQAELVCQCPDIDPDDTRYQNAMTAWAERLANAVNADLISREHANRVWQRATRRTPSDTAA